MRFSTTMGIGTAAAVFGFALLFCATAEAQHYIENGQSTSNNSYGSILITEEYFYPEIILKAMSYSQDPPPLPNLQDSDGDGLTDDAEAAAGTDPFEADSDSDGVEDLIEILLGSDPLTADQD